MTVSFTPTTDLATTSDLGITDLSGGRIVSSRIRPSTLLFTVSGSVDLANARQFGETVSAALQHADSAVIDLSDVEFIGTAALSVMSDIEKDCDGRGATMTVVAGPAATRVMTAARWIPRTTTCSTVDEAVAK